MFIFLVLSRFLHELNFIYEDVCYRRYICINDVIFIIYIYIIINYISYVSSYLSILSLKNYCIQFKRMLVLNNGYLYYITNSTNIYLEV